MRTDVSLTQAATDVLDERRRQIEQEGWTPEHDDAHIDDSMSIAAACYALVGTGPEHWAIVNLEQLWHGSGWSPTWWKPTTRRQNLIKAGALILAEIERLDRAAQAQKGE